MFWSAAGFRTQGFWTKTWGLYQYKFAPFLQTNPEPILIWIWWPRVLHAAICTNSAWICAVLGVVLGVGLAVGFGILNGMWHEFHADPDDDAAA